MINSNTHRYFLFHWSLIYHTVTGLLCDWEVSSEDQRLVPRISQSQSLTGVTLDVCKERCVNESSAPCVAVNYMTADSRCELLLEREYTATVNGTAGWKYHLRPACAGTPTLHQSIESYIHLIYSKSRVFMPTHLWIFDSYLHEKANFDVTKCCLSHRKYW